jgi:hypothetical protein
MHCSTWYSGLYFPFVPWTGQDGLQVACLLVASPNDGDRRAANGTGIRPKYMCEVGYVGNHPDARG